MQICSENGHDEIVYDDSQFKAECPLCKLIKADEELQDKCEDLEDEVKDLKAQIEASEA
jgi:hypothetical protein